uniref:Uncharacterized protein n=1 Tax=Rhizophora mucronata TaxID=61149 RepID=A0A2P2R2H9_RHIMU
MENLLFESECFEASSAGLLV